LFEHLQLDRRLLLGLERLDLVEPTEVQKLVIPAAIAGGDLKIRAETGSGKTLAYLLPAAELILAAPAAKTAGTLVLIMVPTRELARQVLKHCRALLAKSPIGVQAITGGADFQYQQAIFRRNPEIIIATPGRLLEHCERRSADFSGLRLLVLDEADRMLDMGFRDDVLKINGYCNPDKQVMMLSATLKHKGMGDIAAALLRSPQTITVGELREPHGSIFHQRILTDNGQHRDQVLTALLQAGGFQRALVFSNTRREAARLAGLLAHHGLRCAELHGELTTEQRKLVMSRFAEGKVDIVCASDLAARGLDVKNIDLVINYDLPRSGDDYLHRTGRTGRAGARGLAVSLVGATDWNLMISIERYLKIAMEARTLPGLTAKYKGPKHQKNSGKAAGSKKKTRGKDGDKSKTRQRNKKNKGKRRTSDDPATPVSNDGFAPLMKKKPRS
jgi:superfamily II DNA/RNA helicase